MSQATNSYRNEKPNFLAKTGAGEGEVRGKGDLIINDIIQMGGFKKKQKETYQNSVYEGENWGTCYAGNVLYF